MKQKEMYNNDINAPTYVLRIPTRIQFLFTTSPKLKSLHSILTNGSLRFANATSMSDLRNTPRVRIMTRLSIPPDGNDYPMMSRRLSLRDRARRDLRFANQTRSCPRENTAGHDIDDGQVRVDPHCPQGERDRRRVQQDDCGYSSEHRDSREMCN